MDCAYGKSCIHKNTVILTGAVSNARKAAVSYDYLEAYVTDNIMIFDVEVSEVLSCDSDTFSDEDVISVSFGYSMNRYCEGSPKTKTDLHTLFSVT